MPENRGPLGFPRMTGIGPLVETYKTLYFGTDSKKLGLDEGICLTDDPDIASNYIKMSNGHIYKVKIPLDKLNILEWEPYDRDENWHDSDDPEWRRIKSKDYDIVHYEDEDIYGKEHETWRILSYDAVRLSEITGEVIG